MPLWIDLNPGAIRSARSYPYGPARKRRPCATYNAAQFPESRVQMLSWQRPAAG